MALEHILQRSSVRAFSKHKLTNREIELIKSAINSSPTSTNAHQFSAILITNQKLKDAIMEANYGQKHIGDGSGVIVFVGDRYRLNKIIDRHKIHIKYSDDYVLNELTRMIMDATISSAVTQAALGELGFGTAYIGGLQSKGHEVARLLKLPKHCFVVVGLSFGIPLKPIKASPRFNKVFLNEYNTMQAEAEIDRFNQTHKEYFRAFLKTDYVTNQANQMASSHYYHQHFISAGKYLNAVLKNLK